jgi:hypothetical protein
MQGITPSQISKTFYLDVLDSVGKLMIHLVLPIEQSSAIGSFQIPIKYTSDKLSLKGYTRWMLNFDSSFLYSKDIKVSQLKKKMTFNPHVPDVQFFPEGGWLVAGLTGRLAFLAKSPDGLPVDLNGIIKDSKDMEVASFKTVHNGMGRVSFKIEPGETYTALWKDGQGITHSTALPKANENGLVLHLHSNASSADFTVERPSITPEGCSKAWVVATMHQNLVYMASVNLEQKAFVSGNISTNELPSGILTVTLFDNNWQARAERIVFVDNQDYLFQAEAGFATLNFSKRSNNMVSVFVPSGIVANLSLSITDGALKTDSSDNIISRLLMTSDIKGHVYKANYYFSDTTDRVRQDRDLVMQTHGWRRINWQDLVDNKMPVVKYENDVEYLTLKGKVYGMTSQDNKSGSMLLIISENLKDKSREMKQIPVLPDGTFNKQDAILFDTTKVFYKLVASDLASKTAEVAFNNLLLPATQIKPGQNDPKYITADTSQDERSNWYTYHRAMMNKRLFDNYLEEVIVKAKTKTAVEILDNRYATGLFSGGDSYQFDVANDPNGRVFSVFTFLTGKVAGLQISNTTSGVGALPTLTWRGQTPQLFLDQTPVDISQLANINMNDVAYVKVFRPPFFGSLAGGGAGGAIAVYTKRGETNVHDPKSPGMPYKIVIGYTGIKDYYMPNYSSLSTATDVEDIRSTLLWKPDLYFDGKLTTQRIPFYNNDISSSYRIVLEGIDEDGRLIRVEKLVE